MELIHVRINDEARASQIEFEDKNIISRFDKAEFVLGKKASLDDNDFYIELKINAFKHYDIKKGDLIFIAESEYGGVVKKIDHSTDDIVKVSGPNWRYLLHNYVIFPKYDATYSSRGDYLLINAEANKAIETLMNNTYYSYYLKLFKVADTDSTVNLNFKARYEYLYDKIVSILDSNDMRLKVYHSYDYDQDSHIIVEAIKKNYIDDVFNGDYKMSINSVNDMTSSVDTIVALGKGELHERDVVLIKHIIQNGKDVFKSIESLENDEVGTLNSSMYIYDYSSCESKDDLINKAIEEFKNNHLEKTEITSSVSNIKKEFDLGDVITGVDDITGLNVSSEITQKKLTIQNGKVEITYKVGD